MSNKKRKAKAKSVAAPDGSYALKRGEIVSDELSRQGASDKKGFEKASGKNNFGKVIKQYFLAQWKCCGVLRRIIVILSLLLFLFSFSPLIVLVWCIGSIPPALIGLFFAAASFWWDKLIYSKKLWVNIACIAVATAVSIGSLGMAFISGRMLGAAANTLPAYKTRVTLIVLGCRIIGDQPSLMLHDRLEVAAEYLLQNPEAYCVLSGGQGADENYPEGEIMKKYLVDKGISEKRLIAETESTSTEENIKNSIELIEQFNCWKDIVIVTDRFHQYRASLWTDKLGVNSYSLSCETRWFLAMPFWYREMATIVKYRLETDI